MTLSLTEYNRLIDLAGRPPQGPAAAPVAAVLSSADLRVRVDRETARGVFTLTGDVLRPGVAASVCCRARRWSMRARPAGRCRSIADGTAHTALLPGPGPFALTLEWGAPLTFTPGTRVVRPAGAAGGHGARDDRPAGRAGRRPLSSGLVTRRSTAGGRTIVEATLDPGRRPRCGGRCATARRWRPRAKCGRSPT